MTASFVPDLQRKVSEWGLGIDLVKNEPLFKHSSLAVGGEADVFVEISKVSTLLFFLQICHLTGIPVFVMGQSSNILFADRGVRGVVAKINFQNFNYQVLDDHGMVYVEAGLPLPVLVRKLAKEGWCGFEKAWGIPGTIGGAIYGNAGARGWSMEQSVLRVKVIKPPSSIHWVERKDLQFGYRTSRFKDQRQKEREFIVAAELLLIKDDPRAIKKRLNEYFTFRQETQPFARNLGCIFKNPPHDFAGRLIDEVGLKGHRIGGAQVSVKHANFFVNRGKATTQDLVDLIDYVRIKVWEHFAVELEVEIELVGEFGSKL